uniref:ATP-dependent 6-phosphofructokinase n=1 Tax=Lachnospira eligens TaxID=39485 RepID=UPI003FF05316
MKIGMLTSGGDCQSLNAAMRGVAKTLYNNTKDVEIYGFLDGYKGMITKNYKLMKEEDFSGILTEGGTILGTSRTPFKYINEPDEEGRDKVAGMIKTYKDLKLDCLVMLGGNGSHKTAALLSQKGLNVVTLPKTIDNDIEGTEMSFGFQSAIDVATRTIDEIHTTAASHSRVFIVEIMGHKTGWLTLHSGIAGGADIILIPEIPYNVDEVLDTIRKREKQGVKGYTDNIRVVSVVGRFLEHSRIYRFGRGDDQKIYIASADFMTRNTTRRVEVAAPVLDKHCQERIIHIFDLIMQDDEKGKEQNSDGVYCDRHINNPKIDSQETLYEESYEAAASAD